MRFGIVLLLVLGLAAVACAVDNRASGVRVGPAPVVKSMCPDLASPLPANFDHRTGYYEEKIGPNTYRAWITQPMDPSATVDVSRTLYAKEEGWVWNGYSGYEGTCRCDVRSTTYKTPEMRSNLYSTYQQAPYFKVLVPSRARTINITSAKVYMYNCETYGSSIVHTAYDGTVTPTGYGNSYGMCCGSFTPYCNTDGGTAAHAFVTAGGSTTPGGVGWYNWDITAIARAWAAAAPTTKYLLIKGASGAAGYIRWSTACNTSHPTYKPYFLVVFTAN
jgi:hypothetical protein